jgi:alanyl aminopeptidase
VPRYRAWVRRTYGAAASQLGFAPKPGEEDDDKDVRSQLLYRMAEDGEDPATKREATRLAWKFLKDRKAISPDMVGTVLSLAAHAGDAKLYDRFLEEARKANRANDKADRERFLGALAGFEAPELVGRTRQLAMADEFPRLETQGLLWVGQHDQAGRQQAWQFMVDNYDTIHGRLPAESRAGLIRMGADCTQAGLDRAAAFFKDRTPKELSGPRTFKRFVENQTLCIARRAKDTASFVEFLREQTGGGAQARAGSTAAL